MGSESRWREPPDRYPPCQTCHWRFQQWVRSGKLGEALRALARQLHEQGKLNWGEAVVDAISQAQEMGPAIGHTRRGKATKIIAIAADKSLPLADAVDNASQAECNRMEDVLAGIFLAEG